MYTERETTIPSPFTFLHNKVAPSLFPYFIQNDVTSQLLSLSLGFKKPRPILLVGFKHTVVHQLWIEFFSKLREKFYFETCFLICFKLHTWYHPILPLELLYKEVTMLVLRSGTVTLRSHNVLGVDPFY